MEFPWLVRSGVAISQQLAPVGVRSSTEEDGKDANRPIPTPNGRKRKGNSTEDSNKKIKIAGAKIKTIEAVGSTGALVEASLVNSKVQGVNLHIKSQNRVYIFNQGNQVAVLKNGLILCGFGKGKWRLQNDGANDSEFNSSKEVLYTLDSPDNLAPGIPQFHTIWCTMLFLLEVHPVLTESRTRM